MIMNYIARLSLRGLVLTAVASTVLFAQTQQPAAAKPAEPEWVERSNANAKIVFDAESKFQPEGAALLGLEGFDDQILDITPGYEQRRINANQQALQQLNQRLAAEKEQPVKQDLEILIKAA